MKLRKKIELIIINILAIFSPKIAKLFAFRKVNGITFSNAHRKQGEIELLLLPYLLNKDSLFIDVGSNKGVYSFFSEKIISENNIIAFEPVPKLAAMLKGLFPKAIIIEKALSDHKGKAVLNIPIHTENYLLDTRSTLEEESPELLNKFEKITVETITLDEFIKSNKIENITLIKIDVEGHELKLLKGSENTLIKNHPFLIIEIELINHKDNLNTIFQYIDHLEYLIFYLEIKSHSLIQVYNSDGELLVPLEKLKQNHNYICIPKINSSFVQNINEKLNDKN